MILLIQELQEKYDLLDENLNSIMILLILDATCTSYQAQLAKFKFHYDSINSTIERKNNTEFLWFKFHYDSINSKPIYRGSEWYAEFKFHYDSINSRPKIIPLFKPKNVSILSTSSKFNISFLSLIIYFCNTSYFRRFRLLSIPYIFCTIMGRQKPPNFSSWFCSTHSIMKLIC